MIRDLHLKAYSISEIARVIGHDRKTVKNYLNLETAPKFQKRPTRPGKLDPYKPYILKKLNEEGSYTAAQLFREIQKMGFDGGKTIVKDFVGKLRPR